MGSPTGSGELSTLIRQEESVFVAAGDRFAMDGYLRIGTGGARESLEEGLRPIDRVLETLRSRRVSADSTQIGQGPQKPIGLSKSTMLYLGIIVQGIGEISDRF